MSIIVGICGFVSSPSGKLLTKWTKYSIII